MMLRLARLHRRAIFGNRISPRLHPRPQSGSGKTLRARWQLLQPKRRSARVPAKAMQAEKIEQQGTQVYEATRADLNQFKGTAIDGEAAATKTRAVLEPKFTDIAAPETYKLIDRLEKAKSPGEVLDLRKRLGQLGREASGEDRAAARLAKNAVNQELDALIPGTSERLAA